MSSAQRTGSSSDRHDVFLSYNRGDLDLVRILCRTLQDRQIKPWLDEREILPGDRWQTVLDQTIGGAPCIAILVGREGFGPWHINELEMALREERNRGTRVIPVLLPGAPVDSLPSFLDSFAWSDFRTGFEEGELDRLVMGIKKRETTRSRSRAGTKRVAGGRAKSVFPEPAAEPRRESAHAPKGTGQTILIPVPSVAPLPLGHPLDELGIRLEGIYNRRSDHSNLPLASRLMAALASEARARAAWILELVDGSWQQMASSSRGGGAPEADHIRVAAHVAESDRGVALIADGRNKTLVVDASVGGQKRVALLVGVPGDSTLLSEPFATAVACMVGKSTHANGLGAVVGAALDQLKSRYGFQPERVFLWRRQMLLDEARDLLVVFQPIVCIAPGHVHIAGWEALARAPGSSSAPVDMFAAAQLWGPRVTVEVDEMLIRRAMKSYSAQTSTTRVEERQPLSVNVFPTSLMGEKLLESLKVLLLEQRLLRHVVLELSEKVMAPDSRGLRDNGGPHSLRDRIQLFLRNFQGMHFGIDDFGVGHSGIERLTSLQLRHVKLDQSVIRSPYAEETIRFVQAVAQRRLDHGQVVVEGFDGTSALTLFDINRLGVEFVQGHALGPTGESIYRLDRSVRESIEARVRVGQ